MAGEDQYEKYVREAIDAANVVSVADVRREFDLERDWIEWDREIERDSASGKLENMFAKARADHAAGKSPKL